MKDEIKGKAILDFEKIINTVAHAAWDEGEKQGRKNGVNEYQQETGHEMEINATEFVVEQFKECNTLLQFQDKYKEIVALNCNFM